MKKSIITWLAILLSMLPRTIAEGIGTPLQFGFAPGIAANYVQWENEYRVSNIDLGYQYMPDDDSDDKAMLFVDDIAILYDNNTLRGDCVLLFYMDGETSALDMVEKWKKASALFCALEYGDVYSDAADVAMAKRRADAFLEKLNEAISSDYDDLENAPVVFFTGRYADYYVSYLEEDGQWVILAQ